MSEKNDRSPNVKALIKNFERSLSPVISYQPQPALSVVRSSSIEEYDNESASVKEIRDDRNETKEKGISDSTTLSDVKHFQGDETLADSMPPPYSVDNIISDNSSDIPSQLQDTAQISKDVFIKQREEVIKGLKRHFSLNKASTDSAVIDNSPNLRHISSHEKRTDLIITIPVDSPVADLDTVYVSSHEKLIDILSDVESPFVLDFDNVQSFETPLPTRYGDIDYQFSSLIKHCQSVIAQLTPKQKRENPYSSNYDEKSDHENQIECTNKCHRLGECRDICKKMWFFGIHRFQVAIAGMKDLVAIFFQSIEIAFRQRIHLGIGAWMAWISLLLSMIASLYPTVPKSNTAITCFCIFNYYIEHELLEADRHFHVFFLVLTLLASAINLSWLLFPYYTAPLGHRVDSLAYNISQEKSATRSLSWYCLLTSTVMNIAATFMALKSRSKSRRILGELLNKLLLFLPIIPSQSRHKKFKDTLAARIIAILWLHLLSFCVFLSVGLIAQFQLGWSVQFSTPYPISLIKLTFIKAGTCFGLVLAILINADFWDALAEFGCLNPCHARYHNRQKRLYLKRGFHAGPAVVISSSFLSFNAFMKLIDEATGILMWISLSHALAVDGPNAIKQIQLMIGFSFLALSFSDILGLLLVATVFYYSWSTIKSEDQHIAADIEDKKYESVEEQSSINNIDAAESNNIRSPADFSVMWRSLPSGMTMKCHAKVNTPTLHQCLQYIGERKFTVIASGTVDHDDIKIFAFALKDGVPGLISIEIDNDCARILLKCRVDRYLDFFLHQLAPEALFRGKFRRE